MRFTLSLLSLFAFTSCASFAPPPKPAPRPAFVAPWEKACHADSEKICAKWSAKDGTRMDCLARGEKDLNGRCYETLRQAAAPCVFDRARLCSQFKPSDPRVWSCLTEKGKAVSLNCRTFRAEVAVREKTLRKVCGDDTEKLCPSQGAAPWRCLRERVSEVSANCRGEIARSLKGKRNAG